jgi:hypothetical protein
MLRFAARCGGEIRLSLGGSRAFSVRYRQAALTKKTERVQALAKVQR